MVGKILLAPLSWIYGAAVNLRQKFFDWKILKSEEFDIPVVCVGNLTVGGTGKTPHTEYLVDHFRNEYNVAVLSRGYKRRSRGFVVATPDTSYARIGDEPKQIKVKFPDIPVAVCEKRAEGIRKLRALHPEVNLIILDDAFQHRQVEAWVNILLVDYNRPVYNDKFLPLGRLRDSVRQMKRAQIVITTKCPDDLKPIDYRVANKALNLYPYQSLFFTRMVSRGLVPIFPDKAGYLSGTGYNVLAMAGIANPDVFFAQMAENHNVVETISRPDHYAYRMRDIARMKNALAGLPDDTIIVVTEKDAVKLTNRKKIPASLQRVLYYSPIEVSFLVDGASDFKRKIDQYVQANHKYRMLHPE